MAGVSVAASSTRSLSTMIHKQQASGFYVWNDHMKGVPGLGADSERIDECVAYYHAQGFGGWFAHPDFGFRQDDLDFLTRTPTARWLWFWDVASKTLTPSMS